MAKYFLTKDLFLRASTGLLSLRPGGTSAEASNSITCRLISKGGRWRIDNTLNGYIEEIIKDRLSVTKISILYNQGCESRVTNEPKKQVHTLLRKFCLFRVTFVFQTLIRMETKFATAIGKFSR